MHGKCECFAELRRVSNIFVEDCQRRTVLCDFRDSGANTKILISLFFANFCLIYSLAGRNCRFFENLAKKHPFLKYQKNDVYKK